MKEWKLLNPTNPEKQVEVRRAAAGRYWLLIKGKYDSRFKAYDDYMFPSDSAAKRYYSTHFQSIKDGYEKTMWEEIKQSEP